MLTLVRNCPRCGSWEIYKSRFRFLEFVLPVFLLRPVRCGDCQARHYRLIFYAALDRYHDAHSTVQPNAEA